MAIDGKFDDCQAMVKRAFADPALKHIPLSSANSINIGRLLPQSVYYFYAASRLAKPGEPMVFSIPSGNFGDMMGAVVARQMGLPVKKIIAPVNDNDAFPKFLASGHYEKISPSRNSVSNAMNVGHPSNLARLVAIYGGQMDETGKIHQQPDLAAMRRDLFSSSISDERTRATIREVLGQISIAARTARRGRLARFSRLAGSRTARRFARRDSRNRESGEISRRNRKSRSAGRPMFRRRWQPRIKLPEDFDRMGADYEKFREYLIEHQCALDCSQTTAMSHSTSRLLKFLYGFDCPKIRRHFGRQPRPHQKCRRARGEISRAGRPDRRRRFRDERRDG